MRGLVLALAGLGFIASVAAAQEVALAPHAPDAGDRTAARGGAAAVHIPLVRQLLADPAIRDHIGLTENHWDFSSSDGIPGFGPLPGGETRVTTGVAPRE